MAIKIRMIAQKFGMSEYELRNKFCEFGFKVDSKEEKIDEGTVTKFEEKLKMEMAKQEEVKPKRTKTIEIPRIIPVKELAERMELPVTTVISELMKNGLMVTINENIDFETAAIISEDLGFKVKEEKIDLLKAAKAGQKLLIDDLLKEENEKELKSRAPVVTIVGHVDHGKTTLLDAIRETNITASEAGGITQYISAYQVKKKGKLITFIDTPGHEAFRDMRAQGTKVTDIAVLVVAADEGVKSQTIEAIKYVQEVKVPIVVAITKIDKPNADPEKVKKELADYEILSDEWGGKDVFVPVSGVTKEGIDELLEMILLIAEIEDLKANPNRSAVGTVIESNLEKSRGPVATILIQTGTLKQGDFVVIGETRGKVRFIEDFSGKRVNSAGPSTPVLIGGLLAVPKVGDILQVVENEAVARMVAESFHRTNVIKQLQKEKKVSLDELTAQIKESKVKKLRLVLKADVAGSLEAIKQCLKAIGTNEVAISLVRAGVGNIGESDVDTALTADQIIFGFNVNIDSVAKKLARSEKVQIYQFKVIYELIEKAKELLSKLLKPEVVENTLGRLKVLKIFKTGKKDMIFGGKVTKGTIKPHHLVRVLRGKEQIAKGEIDSLEQEKKAISEAKIGAEVGMHYLGNPVVQEGDIVEVFSRAEKKRSLK